MCLLDMQLGSWYDSPLLQFDGGNRCVIQNEDRFASNQDSVETFAFKLYNSLSFRNIESREVYFNSNFIKFISV